MDVWNIYDSDPPIVDLDITDAFQWALDNKSKDHIIYVPPGISSGARPRYEISDTIVFPSQNGGQIWFGGDSSNSHVTGYHCELEWHGGSGGPMFLCASNNWYFYGRPRFMGLDVCTVGFQLTNAGGINWVEGGSWREFAGPAIKIGLNATEDNTLPNFWGDCYSGSCESTLTILGNPRQKQHFRLLGGNGDTPIAIDSYGPSCVSVDFIYCNQLYLQLNSTVGQPGGDIELDDNKNSGLYEFRNFKSDTQGDPRFVSMTAPIRADVIYSNGVQSGGDGKTDVLLNLMGPIVVTLNNFRMGGQGTFERNESDVSEETPVIVLNGCRHFANAPFERLIQGDLVLIQNNCPSYDLELFQNIPAIECSSDAIIGDNNAIINIRTQTI